jgi:hypothetical protein
MKNWLSIVALGVVAGVAASAIADDRDHARRVFRTQLVGVNEVPAVSTTARGTFRAVVNETGTAFTFWLSYSGLGFNASQSHIHFGQHHTNGGISVWLCESVANPAPAAVSANVSDCPLRETVTPITGTITAADVIGPAGQGIAASEFAELLAAMRAGAAYANVHSGVAGAGFPGGEIRGQIH